MLWCHWVVSKSCLEVSIWTFLQSLSWCFEPGCEKRELSDTECSCGNDMSIKKQVYPEVYPFWLKYVPNIRLSMEKSTLNCVILTGLGYIWWFGLHPWGSGRLSLNESQLSRQAEEAVLLGLVNLCGFRGRYWQATWTAALAIAKATKLGVGKTIQPQSNSGTPSDQSNNLWLGTGFLSTLYMVGMALYWTHLRT